MIKNYFKVAFRNLWKNKISSLINTSGLTIDKPFEFHFLDEDFDNLYNAELRLGEVMDLFSFIANGHVFTEGMNMRKMYYICSSVCYDSYCVFF